MSDTGEFARMHDVQDPGGDVGETRVSDAPLSVGDYVFMFILFSIPFVNLILMLVWGFGGGVNINRRNCARAYLILLLIAFFIGAVMGLVGFLLAGRMGPILEDIMSAGI